MRGGKALNGSAADAVSPASKPVMNSAAREKTWLKSNGVSNGFGNGDSPNAARI